MELTAERKKVNKDITQTIRIIISAMRRSLEISLGQVMMESESKHIYVLPVPKGLIRIRTKGSSFVLFRSGSIAFAIREAI